MKIHKLEPHLTYKVWGGKKLKNIKAPHIEGSEPLGETWEVSRHKDGPSKTLSGVCLDELYDHSQLPYLVKFIDTSDNLSVQVHPGDDYAREHENDSGKSECWIILEADKGSGIYLGLKDGVTKEDLKKSIESGEKVNELLNFYEVKAGDFFFVPNGSIHAIGKGVMLAEVQQSSGVTYRVWDWNRVGMDGKARELHIDKALDVIEFEREKNSLEYFKFSKNNYEIELKNLVNHRDFKLEIFNPIDDTEIVLEDNPRLISIISLDGEVEVEDTKLKTYEACIVDEDDRRVTIMAKKGTSFLIVS